MKEIWKDIPDYEGLYQISNLGRVKSLERIAYRNQKIPERIMSQIKHKRGYMTIKLNKNGKRSKLYTHRLVGKGFVPNPKNYPIINHLDEDKLNNKAVNLEWCTDRMNINHSANKRALSKHPGVQPVKKTGKFVASCTTNGKTNRLGTFETESEAAEAYVDFCNANNIEF